MHAGIPALRQRHRHVTPNATVEQDRRFSPASGWTHGGLTGEACNRGRDVDQRTCSRTTRGLIPGAGDDQRDAQRRVVQEEAVFRLAVFAEASPWSEVTTIAFASDQEASAALPSSAST